MLFAALTLWAARNDVRYFATLRSYSRISLWGAAEFQAQKSPAVASRAYLYLDWSGREDSNLLPLAPHKGYSLSVAVQQNLQTIKYQ